MASPTRPSPPPPTAIPPGPTPRPRASVTCPGSSGAFRRKRTARCLAWFRAWQTTARSRCYHRRAAAVGVCEPRQGREAAALSIPPTCRGYRLEKSGPHSRAMMTFRGWDGFVAAVGTAGKAASGGGNGLGILDSLSDALVTVAYPCLAPARARGCSSARGIAELRDASSCVSYPCLAPVRSR